jgi:hypothetical protein
MLTEAVSALADRAVASAQPDSQPRVRGGPENAVSRMLLGIAIVWFVLDATLGFSGFFSRHARRIALFVVSPPLAFVAAFVFSRRLRSWVFACDTRALASFQTLRVGGIAFLAVAAVGKPNPTFALWAGLLDAVTGVSTLFVAHRLVPARTARQRGLFLAWMAAGLLDFVVAIPLAARLRGRDPASMAALSRPPLSMITTYAVPVALMDYFVLGAQLWRQRREVQGDGSPAWLRRRDGYPD